MIATELAQTYKKTFNMVWQASDKLEMPSGPLHGIIIDFDTIDTLSHDPVALIANIRTRHDKIPIIGLSEKFGRNSVTFSETQSALCFMAGMDDGYHVTNNDTSLRVLSERFKRTWDRYRTSTNVNNSEAEANQTQITAHGLIIDQGKGSAQYNGKTIDLRPLEFRTLLFLATRPDVVFSRNDIMDGVYPPDVHVEERTIDALVKGIRNKLNSAGCHDVIGTIYCRGYRFMTEQTRQAHIQKKQARKTPAFAC